MSELTFEALLKKHPNIAGLEVQFAGSGDEGCTERACAVDKEGSELGRASLGGADHDRVCELAEALLDAALARNNLDGYENNQGGVIDASFNVVRHDDDVSVILDSDNIRYYGDVEKKEDFQMAVKALDDVLITDARLKLNEEQVAALKEHGEAVQFEISFSAHQADSVWDDCICITPISEDNHVLIAAKDTLSNALSKVDLSDGDDQFSFENGGRGIFRFSLSTDGILTWDKGSSELYCFEEVLKASGVSMVGMEFNIKGDEIIPINEPEDALSSTAESDHGLSQ